MSVGSGVMDILPASSADMSRISLSSRSRCWAEFLAVLMQSRWCWLNGPSSSSMSSMPSMPLNGVRSSWLMLAKNWLFSRLALSAWALAQRSSVLRASSAICARRWWRCRIHNAMAAPNRPTACATSSHVITWFCSCRVLSCSSINWLTSRLATNDNACTSGPSAYSVSKMPCSAVRCCQGCAISGSTDFNSVLSRSVSPSYSGLARSGAMLGVWCNSSARLSKISYRSCTWSQLAWVDGRYSARLSSLRKRKNSRSKLKVNAVLESSCSRMVPSAVRACCSMAPSVMSRPTTSTAVTSANHSKKRRWPPLACGVTECSGF